MIYPQISTGLILLRYSGKREKHAEPFLNWRLVVCLSRVNLGPSCANQVEISNQHLIIKQIESHCQIKPRLSGEKAF